MKNRILLPLIAIIFLSSCANKFSLTKRKYTKGYYFASSKNHSSSIKEKEQNLVVAQKLSPKKPIALSAEGNKINPEIKFAPLVDLVKVDRVIVKHKKNVTVPADLTASADAKSKKVSKLVVKPVTEKEVNTSSKKQADSDANLIVLVILSLFPILCLFAVYIHDKKSITLNFWLDLILHITFYGECIYALLVVLNVVDLS